MAVRQGGPEFAAQGIQNAIAEAACVEAAFERIAEAGVVGFTGGIDEGVGGCRCFAAGQGGDGAKAQSAGVKSEGMRPSCKRKVVCRWKSVGFSQAVTAAVNSGREAGVRLVDESPIACSYVVR